MTEHLLPKAAQPSSGCMSLPTVVFTPPATPEPRSELGMLLNCLGARILLPWVQDETDSMLAGTYTQTSSCERGFKVDKWSCQPVQDVCGSGLGKEALILHVLNFRDLQFRSL